MFVFEKHFSLFAFAVGWGLLVTADFSLRMMGLAGYHGIQTGFLLPYTAPIMSVIVVFAFGYFLTSPKQELSKKFYASCNYLMLLVLSGSLLVDFILRLTAFDQTYCRGMDDEAFAQCKDEHIQSQWWDLVKLAAMIRLMFYSTQVLEAYTDTVEKTETFDN